MPSSLNEWDQSAPNFVALGGAWDVSHKDRVKALFEALDADLPATLDLRELTYMDSTILSLMAALALRFRKAPITLLGPNSTVRSLLVRMRFDELFKIVDPR